MRWTALATGGALLAFAMVLGGCQSRETAIAEMLKFGLECPPPDFHHPPSWEHSHLACLSAVPK